MNSHMVISTLFSKPFSTISPNIHLFWFNISHYECLSMQSYVFKCDLLAFELCSKKESLMVVLMFN